jgi:ParB family transcriptional regulator, chromosome partitioning protein
MSKRRGLGRGLGALIPEQETENNADLPSSGLKYLDPSQIEPNPHQPRTDFESPEAKIKLEELTASIKEHGLIQPLIVTYAEGERYYLIAGERRWRAAQKAGLTSVPVVVKEATPQEMLELAIIENVQRADLNAIEEAMAYRHLKDEFGLTQEQVADRVGKARPTIANLIRLLDLPDTVQNAIINNQISGRHARAMLRLPTPTEQNIVLNSVVRQKLNVSQTELLIEKMLRQEKPTPRPKPELPPDYKAVEDGIREALGSKVELKKSGRQGRIIIHFASPEDLAQIYDIITRRGESE